MKNQNMINYKPKSTTDNKNTNHGFFLNLVHIISIKSKELGRYFRVLCVLPV